MNVVKNREVVKSEPICAKNTCKTDLWLVSRYLVGSPMLVEGQIECDVPNSGFNEKIHSRGRSIRRRSAADPRLNRRI